MSLSAEDSKLEPTEPPSSAAAETPGGGRSSIWEGFLESCSYIYKTCGDKSIEIREHDRTTDLLLKFSFVAAVAFLALPLAGMKSLFIPCYVFADLLFIAAVTIFVVTRFGVITTMPPRNALVCWQLMVGTALLSIAMFVNFTTLVVIMVSGDRIQTLLPF